MFRDISPGTEFLVEGDFNIYLKIFPLKEREALRNAIRCLDGSSAYFGDTNIIIKLR